MSKLATENHHTYSFNDFSIDLDRGCLLHAGREVKLRPKVFDALCYLVENNKRLVTKAELIGAIWPGSFVTDDSLVQVLVELRRALGDDAQHYIKTVPRRGYIFDAVVISDWAAVEGYTEQVEGVRIVIEEGDEERTRDEGRPRADTHGARSGSRASIVRMARATGTSTRARSGGDPAAHSAPRCRSWSSTHPTGTRA